MMYYYYYYYYYYCYIVHYIVLFNANPFFVLNAELYLQFFIQWYLSTSPTTAVLQSLRTSSITQYQYMD